MIKKIIPVAILAALMLGCDGDDSSSTPSASSAFLQSYKTQLMIDASDLQHLQKVKYASNNGTGFSTPENFKK